MTSGAHHPHNQEVVIALRQVARRGDKAVRPISAIADGLLPSGPAGIVTGSRDRTRYGPWMIEVGRLWLVPN